jgi:hypothetical protein
MIHESGALPVYHEYMVVPANTYDSLIAGSDYIDAQVRGLDDIDLSATMKTSVNTEADTALTDYDPATKAEMDTAHALLATVAKQDVIDGIVDAILVDTGELQTDWANGGRLDLLVDAILADTGELQTDWTNGGRLDLLLDAIKAITDLLTLAAIADAVHDEAVEGAVTNRQLMRYISAALAGKTSEAVANTMVIRDVNDTADRWVKWLLNIGETATGETVTGATAIGE